MVVVLLEDLVAGTRVDRDGSAGANRDLLEADRQTGKSYDCAYGLAPAADREWARNESKSHQVDPKRVLPRGNLVHEEVPKGVGRGMRNLVVVADDFDLGSLQRLTRCAVGDRAGHIGVSAS